MKKTKKKGGREVRSDLRLINFDKPDVAAKPLTQKEIIEANNKYKRCIEDQAKYFSKISDKPNPHGFGMKTDK